MTRKTGQAETRRKPYRRLPPDQQKQRLVEATLACLIRHGVERATVRRIATAADLSLGMIRHHFGGKDALLAATYRHLSLLLQEEAERAMAAAGEDPAARLRAFLSAGLGAPILRADYVRARFLFWGLTHTNAAVRQVHDEIYGRFETRVARLLRAAAGADVPAASLRQRTQLIVALLKGLWLEWSLNPARTRPRRIFQQIEPLLAFTAP